MNRNVKFLGKMPDPFCKSDGTRVTPEHWPEYKKQLRDMIVDYEYGGMPPRPEVLRYELLNRINRGQTSLWYKVWAGTTEKQISFTLEMYIPFIRSKAPSDDTAAPFGPDEKYPVVLSGDGCYDSINKQVAAEVCSRGYIAAQFNRLELANDCKNERHGGLYDIYPDLSFTAISAWAWGYLVCMDIFEQLSFTDETEVGITGHSRGGKTVMLAAAVDERIKYVCPNNSGCHGAVSHRCVVTGQGDAGTRRTERISDMLEMFPTWMGPKLTDYADREQDLPYDMHYFGALIAPRYYLQCEGMQDYWINPVGAWQNFAAVRRCYEYLGCADRCGAWFRPGGHRHELPDYQQFLDFIDRARAGKHLSEHLTINPYPEIEKNFDW